MLFCQGRAFARLSKAKATRKARAGHTTNACLLMQPHGLRHVDVNAGCTATTAKKARRFERNTPML
jgi:hypothetical protein